MLLMIEGQDVLFTEEAVGGRVVTAPAAASEDGVKCRRCPATLRSEKAVAAGVGATCALHEAAERRMARAQRRRKRRRVRRT